MACAYVQVIAWQEASARRMGRRLGIRLSGLDEAMRQYIVSYYLLDRRGTTQQELVHAFDAPRRTVRTGLARLEACCALVREGGLYYPANRLAGAIEADLDDFLRALDRFAEAHATFKRSLGRNTP